MTRLILVVLVLLGAGCTTSEQRAEYERKRRSWRQDSLRSADAWQDATGGQWSGGGSPMPPPEKPSEIRFD